MPQIRQIQLFVQPVFLSFFKQVELCGWFDKIFQFVRSIIYSSHQVVGGDESFLISKQAANENVGRLYFENFDFGWMTVHGT